MRPLEFIHLGRVGYAEATALMEQRVQDRLSGRVPDALLLLEHEPVVTLGRRARQENLLFPAAALRERGVDVVESGRGGDVTYHGPGQIVGYPVIDLRPERKDVRRFVTELEETMIRTCARFGVSAAREAGLTGTWVEGTRKIGAIGVRIRHWVSSHGFALNVTGDSTQPFEWIVPCGISNRGVTSLSAETGRSLAVEGVMPVVQQVFGELFGRRTLRSPADSASV